MTPAERSGGPTRVGHRGRAVTALALAGAALALGACGDDDEEATTPTGTTGTSEEFETTTVPATVAPPPAGPESEPSGGISSDQPTDPDPEDVADPESSPGGAGDEANDPVGGGGSGGGGSGSGGGGKGSGGGGSGGVSPEDSFDQFCEDNPRACE